MGELNFSPPKTPKKSLATGGIDSSPKEEDIFFFEWL